jgi:uncharacterized protein YigE (DUF2233 family)
MDHAEDTASSLDCLGSDNALFLDGGMASGLYAPELGRDDAPGTAATDPIIAALD